MLKKIAARMERALLQAAGLTEGEAKVYLALLETGLATSGKIVKKSGVSKSIVYHLLAKLMEKGLVSFIVKEKTKHFQAADPSKLLEFLTAKDEELRKTADEIEKALPRLLALQQARPSSEARVYTGLRGVRTAHEHLYDKLERGESYFSLGVPAYQPEEMHRYWQRDHIRRIKAGIRCKLLFNADTDPAIIANRNTFTGAEARAMPTDIKTPALFHIYKDTVAVILQHPVAIAVEIVNQEIADSFKAYFDQFWKQDVRTYHGAEGVRAVFDDTLGQKDVWFIGGNWGIKEYHYEYWKRHEQERRRKRVVWHDLIVRTYSKEHFEEFLNKSEKELRQRYFYEYRWLPQELASPNVICVYGDKVANILWGKETTITVIERREVAEYYKKYFTLLWQMAGEKTKVEYGREGALRALRSLMEEGVRGSELLGFGSDDDGYVRHCRRELKEYFRDGKRHHVRERLLFGEGFRSPNPMARIRLLPKGFSVPVRIMVGGDKVFIVDFSDRITTITIEKKAIADAYRKQFDYLWKDATPARR
jgi:HTH-type transcriptional regulator, sugar sensing transcriptional regulator